MAFWLERCLPRSDLGPLECFELLRLASRWASDGLDIILVFAIIKYQMEIRNSGRRRGWVLILMEIEFFIFVTRWAGFAGFLSLRDPDSGKNRESARLALFLAEHGV